MALWDDPSLRARAVLKGSAVKEHTRQEVQSAFRGPEQSKEQGAETSGSESFQDCERGSSGPALEAGCFR